jgi:uncharacterized protein (DUF697 family)
MPSVSVRKVWKALVDVRRTASGEARICLVGGTALLTEAARLLSAGAADADAGVSSALDVLGPRDLPTRADQLARWSVVVFLEDAAAPIRPELRGEVAFCHAAGRPVVVAVVRDTEVVAVDRQAWLTEVGVASREFVVHTRGTTAYHAALARRLAAVAGDDGLRLAAVLPALRPAVVEHIIDSTSRQNAVVGVLVFVPGADMPVMTLNQIKMVLKIGAAYGHQPTPERFIEMMTIIASGFGIRALARKGVTYVPGLGWALKGVVGYTGTQAIGRAAVAYFERGAPLTPHRLSRLRGRFGQLAQGTAR